jgi:ParB-like chromosome segregation protein Spo0J
MIETVELAVTDLEPHPQNAKTHDIELLKESIGKFGQYRAIVAQKPRGNRKRHRILAGHGTFFALRELGYETVSVHPHDVDDDTAKRIVLMDNRAPERGGFNEQALTELLASMGGDYEATGYSQADYDKMVKAAEQEAEALSAEPQPLPDKFEVLVEVGSEDEQVALLERLTEEGFSCRALL